jgi:hypothetical protein
MIGRIQPDMTLSKAEIAADKAAWKTLEDENRELRRRADVADEMLADLSAEIGTGPGLASLRRRVMDIKNELRGLVRARSSTAP